MRIPFLIPDITQAEVDAVSETLMSGWITTGPAVRQFESELAHFMGTGAVACTSSATAALECALRLLGIGPGDEVITTPYTYTASCSVIVHVGARPVLVDTAADSLEMDYERLYDAITPNTKAIIPVDVGGIMCDYDTIFSVVERHRQIFQPRNDIQEAMGRIAVIADAAHSVGATYHGRPSGSVGDFSAFSFHAVKNLTTGEGGALTWREIPGFDDAEIFRRVQLLILHGQSKSALDKTNLGTWEYDIVDTNFKWNMTDIAASIGIVQLHRYPEMLARRKAILERYRDSIDGDIAKLTLHYTDEGSSSGHLAIVRLHGFDADGRNAFIEEMASHEVVCNVHYKPLPLMTAYRKLGMRPEDYPEAIAFYENEVTLPLHTKLTDEEVDYVIESFHDSYRKCGA
ncbi:MAG: DegT/DnrJ/EryC1/StrS family aminotransferase [Coriobacteriales bacterium]|jgi:dTDP-4-amino-4,6-dideoxygalactose transaminase